MTSAIFNAASYDSLGGSSLTAVANGISWLRAENQSYSYVRDYPTDVLMYLVQSGIDVEDRGSSLEFLVRHPGMVPHLYDLPKALAPFAETSTVSIECMHDDEDSAAEGSQLMAVIHTRLPMNEARAMLRAVHRDWLFQIPDKDTSLLSIVLELKNDV